MADMSIAQAKRPKLSSLIVLDDRIPLMPLVRALAEGGYSVINRGNGQLVVTLWPAEFSLAKGNP